MVGVTKIQRQNAGYWLAAVAQGGDDYYTKPGEAPGEWVGELAEELGLFGQVDAAGYGAILEGRDPGTGKQLVKRPDTRYRLRPDGTEKRVEPVLGYDIRFSAPKSVSLLYALGSDEIRERIVRVMNEAVRQGISHLEREACMVQRGKGGWKIERGSGFVGMAFRHRMSRAGDPALHVHVVVSNLTRAAGDGKWLSLASPRGRSPLFPHGKSAGVVFQAALRAGFLREFGLEFGAVRNGYDDLKGFSRELIESFSTRSREIAAWQEKHGVFSVKAAQTAAYRTRAAKDHGIDPDERVAEWEAQAAPLGFSRRAAEKMVREGRGREPAAIGEEAIAAAVRTLERTASHFDRRGLLWSVAEHLPQGAGHDELLSAVDRIIESDLVVSIHQPSGLLDPAVYTTPRVAEAERRFIDTALAGADAKAGVVEHASVHQALAQHPYLGADQREMVMRLTAAGERVVPVAALPGTGKTTALKAATDAWAQAGYSVFGCATARTAAHSLRDAGLSNATSISSLRYRLEGMGKRLSQRAVVVVDEANVTSTFDLAALLFHVEAVDGKLVLIGDARQIGAIGPGGLFARLAPLLDAVSLTEIRRQHRPVDQRIVTLVHEGRGSEALDLLRTEGKLIVGDDLTSTLHGLLLDWHRDYATGADAVMIARRNRDVDFLNDQARQLRRQAGALGRAELDVGGLAISAGDRVQTRINSREASNRERWDVLSVHRLRRRVRLRQVGGEERVVTLDRRYLRRETPDGAPALQYSYAITKFGAESKTFDRAYPLLDAGATLEQELVAISRGREIANVYTVASSELLDPDLGPARRELSDGLDDAREAIEREGAESSAADVSLHKEIDALSPVELADRRARLAQAAVDEDPLRTRRQRLEQAIGRDRDWIETLAAERKATERLAEPPHAELARLVAAETSTAERLRGAEAELAALPAPPDVDPLPRDSTARLEAAYIERRISRLATREVAAARSGESKIVHQALGPCPDDPATAAIWSDAAYALLTYRLRHGLRDNTGELGQPPRSRGARAEYAQATQRLDAALRAIRGTQEKAHQLTVTQGHSLAR